MGKFMIEIELGNAAMQSGDDIAECLERIAKAIREGLEAGHTVKLRDLNGNLVGQMTWEIADWEDL